MTKYEKYDDHFTLELFSNRLAKHPLDVKAHVKSDNTNTYNLNSMGYRSSEFSKNTELLAAGCSFTFGSGVPENYRWSSLVSNELGKEETNIGVCAWSSQAIIQNIFAYFKDYGHPEILVCLFPDTTRSIVPVVDGFIEYEDLDKFGNFQLANIMLDRNDDDYLYSDKPTYSKRPHSIEDILPNEMSLYYFAKYVHFLEAYCAVAGVRLLWSTWDTSLSNYLEKLSRDGATANYEFYGFNNYLPLMANDWAWDVSYYGGGIPVALLSEAKSREYSCHKDIENVLGENFFIGSDVGQLSHWGGHKHLHIAERFLQVLNG